MSNDTSTMNGIIGLGVQNSTFSPDARESPSPSPTRTSYTPQDNSNNTNGYADEKHPHTHVLDASINSDENQTLADNDAANAIVPAGRLPEEVYTSTLNWWRAAVRRRLVRIVEWESGVLAKVQVRFFFLLCGILLRFAKGLVRGLCDHMGSAHGRT